MQEAQELTKKIVQHWFSEPRAAENASFIAIRDSFPVGEGHTLIISKRRAVDMLELNEEEYLDLQEILRTVTSQLTLEYKPQGYNIGANCGEEAGQTVMHCHIHVIPRYKGDTPNPRGGYGI